MQPDIQKNKQQLLARYRQFLEEKETDARVISTEIEALQELLEMNPKQVMKMLVTYGRVARGKPMKGWTEKLEAQRHLLPKILSNSL